MVVTKIVKVIAGLGLFAVGIAAFGYMALAAIGGFLSIFVGNGGFDFTIAGVIAGLVGIVSMIYGVKLIK